MNIDTLLNLHGPRHKSKGNIMFSWGQENCLFFSTISSHFHNFSISLVTVQYACLIFLLVNCVPAMRLTEWKYIVSSYEYICILQCSSDFLYVVMKKTVNRLAWTTRVQPKSNHHEENPHKVNQAWYPQEALFTRLITLPVSFMFTGFVVCRMHVCIWNMIPYLVVGVFIHPPQNSVYMGYSN